MIYMYIDLQKRIVKTVFLNWIFINKIEAVVL